METVLSLVIDAFTGATERHIEVGDGLQIWTIVKGEGAKLRELREFLSLAEEMEREEGTTELTTSAVFFNSAQEGLREEEEICTPHSNTEGSSHRLGRLVPSLRPSSEANSVNGFDLLQRLQDCSRTLERKLRRTAAVLCSQRPNLARPLREPARLLSGASLASRCMISRLISARWLQLKPATFISSTNLQHSSDSQPIMSPSKLSLSPFSPPSPTLAHLNRVFASYSGQDKVFMLMACTSSCFRFFFLACRSSACFELRGGELRAELS